MRVGGNRFEHPQSAGSRFTRRTTRLKQFNFGQLAEIELAEVKLTKIEFITKCTMIIVAVVIKILIVLF